MKKGFILLEILIGITFLGIIAAASLPVMTNSMVSMDRAAERGEMIYLCDYVAQKLKTDDDEILESVESLLNEGSIEYLDEDIDEDVYSCTLDLMEVEGNYMLIGVRIKSQKYDNMEVRLEVSRQIQGVFTN